MTLPKIKQSGKRVFVLCDREGTAKTMSDTRRGAEAQFCLLFHMILLHRSDLAKMRAHMNAVGWTVREVEVIFKPTGLVYPVMRRKQVVQHNEHLVSQLKKRRRA